MGKVLDVEFELGVSLGVNMQVSVNLKKFKELLMNTFKAKLASVLGAIAVVRRLV